MEKEAHYNESMGGNRLAAQQHGLFYMGRRCSRADDGRVFLLLLNNALHCLQEYRPPIDERIINRFHARLSLVNGKWSEEHRATIRCCYSHKAKLPIVANALITAPPPQYV